MTTRFAPIRSFVTSLATAAAVLSVAVAVPLATDPAYGGKETLVPSTAQHLSAKHGRTVLAGQLRTRSGHVLGHRRMAIYLGKTRTPYALKPLAKQRTTAHGRFRLVIRHRRSLARYAAHHSGLIDVHFLTTEPGHRRTIMRTSRPVKYHHRRVRVGKVRVGVSSSRFFLGPPKGRPMEPSVGSGVYADPVVMTMQVAPDVTSTYKYSQNSDSTIEAGYGVSADSWGVGGTVAVRRNDDTSVRETMLARHHRAFDYTLEMDITHERHCVDINYALRARTGLPVNACTYVPSATWIGDIEPYPTAARSCWSEPNAITFPRHGTGTKTYVKDHGIAISSSVYSGAFGGEVRVNVGFSSDSRQKYEFNRAHVDGDYYCIAGSNGDYAASSKVLVDTQTAAQRRARLARQ